MPKVMQLTPRPALPDVQIELTAWEVSALMKRLYQGDVGGLYFLLERLGYEMAS